MTLNYQNVTSELILAVWNKGKAIVGASPEWRTDDFGNLMYYYDYGKRDSQYGWEIDHITPSSRGGSDAIFNLRPLHWKANSTLGGFLRR